MAVTLFESIIFIMFHPCSIPVEWDTGLSLFPSDGY